MAVESNLSQQIFTEQHLNARIYKIKLSICVDSCLTLTILGSTAIYLTTTVYAVLLFFVLDVSGEYYGKYISKLWLNCIFKNLKELGIYKSSY